MKLTIYTDGASRGNPGHASYGFTITDEKGKLLAREGKYIGITTNNVAEYRGVYQALAWVAQKISGKSFQMKLFVDSKLVAEQLSGRFKIKASHLKPLIGKIKAFESKLGSITYYHIPRSKNSLADKLANEALDRKILTQ